MSTEDIEKRSVGQPMKYKSPEELQALIDNYFEECDNRSIEVYDKKTQSIKRIVSSVPYTIEGLCETLDTNRETINNYSKRDEYFDTIKRARLKVQRNKIERGLSGESVSNITIFDLKNNHGYKDMVEVKNTYELEDYTDSELDRQLEKAKGNAQLLSVNDIEVE